jgi:hypothetical protein
MGAAFNRFASSIGLWSRIQLGQQRGRRDERPHRREIAGAGVAGEQAVMADAMEALGQNMDQKAADKFVRRQGYRLVAAAIFIFLFLLAVRNMLKLK